MELFAYTFDEWVCEVVLPIVRGGVYSKFILVMPPRLLLGLKSQQITHDFSTIALNNNRINIKLLSANKVRNKI